MLNPLGGIIKFILPLIIVYLAFTFLGPIGGLLALAIIILLAVYFNRGIIYQNRAGKKYHNGDYEGALNDLKAAVSFDPNNAKVLGTYAYLLLKLGHTEEAAVQIDQALSKAQLELDKNTLKVTKAMVLWKQGKIDEAIQTLDELLKVFETTNVYATQGFLYIEKGDYQKALEFNLRAKEYNGSSAIILDNLGTSYLLLEDYDKAFEIYQEAMKSKPNFPEAFYNYAKVLEKKSDIEKALYMVRHALTLHFWNTSTVKKEDVEAYLAELEVKEKQIEEENSKNKEKAFEEITESPEIIEADKE